MSRFSDEYDEPEYPNSGDLWWANVGRALNGKRGQQALADLEQALVELPQPRLISGYLAAGGEVCAVGALAVRRRLSNGEKLEAVIADLEGRTPPVCECGHEQHLHAEGTDWCGYRTYNGERGCWDSCTSFRLSADSQGNYDGADETARAGVEVGLTYALAWRLAYLNDEELEGLTPEQRYERVLAWVRKTRLPVAA